MTYAVTASIAYVSKVIDTKATVKINVQVFVAIYAIITNVDTSRLEEKTSDVSVTLKSITSRI